MSRHSLNVHLQINCEYVTHVTFTTVMLQEGSKCYMRVKKAFIVKLIKL